MKEIIDGISKNTFKIWTENFPDIGTAFAIDDSTLLTSNHVVNPEETKKPDYKIHLKKPDGKKYEGTIEDVKIEADLACIVVDGKEKLKVKGPFFEYDSPPDIGEMCIWGGFPKLIGESAPRLRFAQGMASSEIYEVQEGRFFELDGMFNPGHSGSVVINIETGKLVGVVSKSAGDLNKLYDDAVQIFKVVDSIQYKWKLFEQTRKTMNEIWESVSKSIIDIVNQLNEINRGLGGFGSNPYRTELTSPFTLSHAHMIMRIEDRLPDDITKILKDAGLSFSSIESNTFIHASNDAAFSALIRLILEWTKLIREAISESYQMGIGIATCDKPLRRMMS